MKLYFSFILLVTITFCSCKSNKAMLTEENEVKVKEAYIQKIVPGRREMKTKEYLFINFNPYDTQSYLIDSIYYLNKVFYIQKHQLNYQIELNTGGDAKNKEYADSSESSGTIFYHQRNTRFYKKLNGITRKETLFLP